VAAITALGIIQGLDRVNGEKVGAVAFRYIIAPVISGAKIRIDSATGMTVETEGLLVTLGTVAPGRAGYVTMASNPVCVMVGRHAFSLMAFAAFLNLHLGVFFMGLLCGLACSLLLGLLCGRAYSFLLRLIFRRFLGEGKMRYKGRQSKKHKDQKTFFQSSTPFLEIVVKDETSLHIVTVSLVGVVLNPERCSHILCNPIFAAEPEESSGTVT